ncbi:MAG: CPBP family glutamic-type intramembrane protease [Psychrobacillus sp.]
MMFTMIIVSPVIEEIVFRELLPYATGPSYLCFVISSIIFIALHATFGVMRRTSSCYPVFSSFNCMGLTWINSFRINTLSVNLQILNVFLVSFAFIRSQDSPVTQLKVEICLATLKPCFNIG